MILNDYVVQDSMLRNLIELSISRVWYRQGHMMKAVENEA